MDPTHKTCPKCAHRTVVQMPSCQRCGYRWDGGLHRTLETVATVLRPPRPARSALTVLVALSVSIGVLGFVLARGRGPGATPPNSVVAVPPPAAGIPVKAPETLPPLTQGPRVAAPAAATARPVTTAPSPSPPQAPPMVAAPVAPSPAAGPSFFTERPSARLTPVLRVRNDSRTPLTLDLLATDGSHVLLEVPPFAESRREVPPGRYLLEVRGADPSVIPATGDATFLRHREYEGNFCLGRPEDQAPVHLGD